MTKLIVDHHVTADRQRSQLRVTQHHIAEAGFGPVDGARPLRRMVPHQLETCTGWPLLS